MGGGWGREAGEKEEAIKKYILLVTKSSRGCELQHQECSQ